MAKDFTNGFYGRNAWRKLATEYRKKKCFCERCTANGILGVAGEIVHHKIYITKENINNPAITMNESNLELLCRDCHEKEHSKRTANKMRRYDIDTLGEVIIHDQRGESKERDKQT